MREERWTLWQKKKSRTLHFSLGMSFPLQHKKEKPLPSIIITTTTITINITALHYLKSPEDYRRWPTPMGPNGVHFNKFQFKFRLSRKYRTFLFQLLVMRSHLTPISPRKEEKRCKNLLAVACLHFFLPFSALYQVSAKIEEKSLTDLKSLKKINIYI